MAWSPVTHLPWSPKNLGPDHHRTLVLITSYTLALITKEPGPWSPKNLGPHHQLHLGPDQQSQLGPDHQRTVAWSPVTHWPWSPKSLGPDHQRTLALIPSYTSALITKDLGTDHQLHIGPDHQLHIGHDHQRQSWPWSPNNLGPDHQRTLALIPKEPWPWSLVTHWPWSPKNLGPDHQLHICPNYKESWQWLPKKLGPDQDNFEWKLKRCQVWTFTLSSYISDILIIVSCASGAAILVLAIITVIFLLLRFSW